MKLYRFLQRFSYSFFLAIMLNEFGITVEDWRGWFTLFVMGMLVAWKVREYKNAENI